MSKTVRPVPRIGVDMLYVAKILTDDDKGTTYDSPRRLIGLNNIGYDPATQSASYDADDGSYESYSVDGDTTVTIRQADLTPEDYAYLFGVQRGETGVITEGAEDSAPYIAVGFRSQKSDGSYRYIWVLKGKASKGSETYQTKSGSGITYNDQEIVIHALNRTSDGAKRRRLDSNDPSLPEGITNAALADATDGWFSSPDYTPTTGA